MSIKASLLIATAVGVAAVALYGAYTALTTTDEEALAQYDAAIAAVRADPDYATSAFLQGYLEGLQEGRAELVAKIAAKANATAQAA